MALVNFGDITNVLTLALLGWFGLSHFDNRCRNIALVEIAAHEASSHSEGHVRATPSFTEGTTPVKSLKTVYSIGALVGLVFLPSCLRVLGSLQVETRYTL